MFWHGYSFQTWDIMIQVSLIRASVMGVVNKIIYMSAFIDYSNQINALFFWQILAGIVLPIKHD